MNLPYKAHPFFKFSASLIACVFLFQQVAWAGDIVNAIPVNKAEERSGYVASQLLRSAQAAIENAVSVDQAAEDFRSVQAHPTLALNGAPAYEYDGLGRIIKTTYDNGDFVIASYYGTTFNKYWDIFFKKDIGWQCTVEYYEGTEIFHKKWTKDADAGVSGDETYAEYDSSGRKFLQKLDDTTWAIISYYGSTNNKYQVCYCDSDLSWQYTIEYYEGTEIMHKKWSKDNDPAVSGDETYSEYDSLGRKFLQKLDDTTWAVISYYGDTSNKYHACYFDSALAWQSTIEYYEGTEINHKKWAIETGEDNVSRAVYYEYYTDGLVEFKNIPDADPSGNVYYHYIHEDWNGEGRGRIDMSIADIPRNGRLFYDDSGELGYEGELSCYYTYYDDAAGRLRSKAAYSNADFTGSVTIYNYHNDETNRLALKIDVNKGITYAYYNDTSNYMESQTLASPDLLGNIFYHYLNEDWNGRKFGRVDKVVMGSPVNGELAHTYFYYDCSPSFVQSKIAYSDADCLTIAAIYTYYEDETNRVASKMQYDTASPGPLLSGAASGEPQGTVTYTYYNDDNAYIESRTNYIYNGQVTEYYLNENWNGRGYGRLSKNTTIDGSTSEYMASSFSYEYYDDDSGRLKTVWMYTDENWTNLFRRLDYSDDEENKCISTFESDGINTTYYNGTGYIESISLSTPTAFGDIYYHYKNEDLLMYEQYLGHGAVDKITRQIPAYEDFYFTSEGELLYSFTEKSFELTYYENSVGFVKDVFAYAGQDYTGLVAIYHFPDSYVSFSDIESPLLSTYGLSLGYGPFLRNNDCYINTATGQEYIIASQTINFGAIYGDAFYYAERFKDGAYEGNSFNEYVQGQNNSGEQLESGIDDQQRKINNYINQYMEDWNLHHLDRSNFRTVDELRKALLEQLGGDAEQANSLFDQFAAFSNKYAADYGMQMPINANIFIGSKVWGVTDDGAIVRLSNFGGESLVSKIDICPFYGHINSDGSYSTIDINILNGIDVEAVITNTLGSYMSRTTIGSDFTKISSDSGASIRVSTPTISSSLYNFIGQDANGWYFGTCYDIKSCSGADIKPLSTFSEAVAYLPEDVRLGERVPVTSSEAYGKIVYDIYYGKVEVLTPEMDYIIRTETRRLVEAAVENDPRVSLNDAEVMCWSAYYSVISMIRPVLF